MTQVLLVGSDKAQISAIDSLLRLDGHIVHVLNEVERWRAAESARPMDLIVVALRPGERIFTVGGRTTSGFSTPMLFVRQGPKLQQAVHRDERVVDRISAPYDEEDFLARVDALIRVGRTVRRMVATSRTDAPDVRSEGAFQRLTTRISAVLGTRIPRYSRPHSPYGAVAARVATWADCRDAFEPGHDGRVASYAALIADRIGLPDDEAETTRRAAMLHDIGKATVSTEILRQRYPLAVEQLSLIQAHPERGATILETLGTDASIVAAIRHHHDRVDGMAPDGISRRVLSRPARILTVADVYDAMTSSQVKPALHQNAALHKMREFRGRQLDAVFVDALCEALAPRPETVTVSRW